jgi:hypothetical protein
MGYTHYWGFQGEAKKEDIRAACDEFNSLIKILNLNVFIDKFDDYGIYKPEINEKRILFNKIDLYTGFETFHVDFSVQPKFEFCKTNHHEQYDRVVCLALLCLANNIPEFHFTSDGTFKDWKSHFDTYEQHVKPLEIRFDQFKIDATLDQIVQGLNATIVKPIM